MVTQTSQSKCHSLNDSLDVRMCTTTALRNAEMISSVEDLPGLNGERRVTKHEGMTKSECRKPMWRSREEQRDRELQTRAT